MNPALFLLLLEGDGDLVTYQGKLCIESITVGPALLASACVTPALLTDSITAQPALLCDVEVNQCQK
jgi:hypothetical protein